MSDQPDQLSQLLLEADGLLLLLHHHRDETPVDAIKLLRRKLELILALTDGLDEWEDDDQEQENAYNNERDNDTEADEYNDPVSDVENNVQSNPSISEDTHPVIPQKNDLINDTVEQDSEILSEQSAIDEYLEDTIEHAVQVQPDTTSQQDSLNKFSNQENSLPVENTTTVISEDIPIEETSFYQPVSNPGIIDNDVVFMSESSKDVDSSTSKVSNTKTSEINSSEILKDSVKDTPRETERRFIDDAPIYKPRLHNDDDSSWISTTSDITASRRPVSSVFNLNDKFRFRRELFGNSDAQYVECLDLLSAMTSIDEAQEYLYDDLQWDPDNEDVKAFIELLSNYYRR